MASNEQQRTEDKTESVAPNLYQRINAVRAAVGYVQKQKEVGSGRSAYMAVTHDAVTAALRQSCIENGILIIPSLRDSSVQDTGTVTSSGTPIIRYEATYEIEFVNADHPSEKHLIAIESHANDTSDKAPGKALSYATKYAMLKVFMLETGEEEEDRVEGVEAPLTEDQLLDLHAVCDEFNVNATDMLQRLAGKVYQLEKIEELPSRYFDDAVRRLRKQLQAGAGENHEQSHEAG